MERLARPEHRGRAWFFWDQEVFGPEWCRTRLDVTVRAAGDRYTPSLNIELPVAFSLEGLGRSTVFLGRYRRRRGAFLKPARRVSDGHYTGLGVTRELAALTRALEAAEVALRKDGVVAGRFERAAMFEAVAACRDLVWAAYPKRETEGRSREGERTSYLRHALERLGQHVAELAEFLDSAAAHAAQDGSLLVTGGAGQGKTHLFCDAGQRALDGGRPAAVLLGQTFTGTRVFSDLAERLGLAARGATEMLGAMAAAGEASGVPFLLLIDALNDSGDPRAWRDELPILLAEIAQYEPWIALGVSVRSSYLDLIASTKCVSDLRGAGLSA